MGLAALAVDEMISGFPDLVLPLVTAEPIFKDTINTQKLPNANCISIHSLAGGGHHIHLMLIMMVQEYAAILSTPISPIAIGTEAFEAASIVCLYNKLKRIHITHLNCDEACKKIMLASYAPGTPSLPEAGIWPHCTNAAC
jgi:hypothetical protein